MRQAEFFERQARILSAAAVTASTNRDANAFRTLARYFEAQGIREADRHG